MKIRISIMQLMFFQSVMSKMLYFISYLHVWEKEEEISFNISEIQPLFLFRKVFRQVMGVARN